MLQNHKPTRFCSTAGQNIHSLCYHNGAITRLRPCAKMPRHSYRIGMLNVAHHLSSNCFIMSAPPLLSTKTLSCFSRDKACSLCSQSWHFTTGFKNNARGWSIHLILIKYFQLLLNKMNQPLEELFTPNLSNIERHLSWFTRQFKDS